MAKKDFLKVVEKLANELLALMGTEAKATVAEDKENDATRVNIEAGEAAGLIIGGRGATLYAIQTLLGMMFRKKFGEWKRIIVDVSSWREKEEGRLTQVAKLAAERARATGEPQRLYNLTPSQRRSVHLALSEDEDVETESEGEGKERYLVITSIKSS